MFVFQKFKLSMSRKKKPEENKSGKKKVSKGSGVGIKKGAVSTRGTAIKKVSKGNHDIFNIVSNIDKESTKIIRASEKINKKEKSTISAKKSKVLKKPIEVKKFSTRFVDYSDSLDVKRERNRLYQVRFRLVRKLERAETKKEKRLIRNELVRSTKYLERITKGSGGKVKVSKSEMTTPIKVSGKVIVREVYKWEVSRIIDTMLNEMMIKEYFIDGRRYTRRDSMDILSDIDDMETEADLRGIYFMIIETNLGKKE
jgi:endonuclease YncB( thermonuclease family)